jgi:Tol biopolymer transport system component
MGIVAVTVLAGLAIALTAHDRARRTTVLAGAIAVVAVSGIVGDATARSSASGDDVIAYQGNGKVYLINADGTDRRALISGAAKAGDVSWSPDALQIAFTAGKQDVHEIDIAAADGTYQRSLTRGLRKPVDAQAPSWSPDGASLAFMAWGGTTWNIYIIGTDGKHLRELAHPADEDHVYASPDWSPDGRWIAFESYVYDSTRAVLLAIHTERTGLHRIATFFTGKQCICADWSPDGSKIAYQASKTARASSRPEIIAMNSDGSGRVQLTDDPARDENPDWSPDGMNIAFYSERDGNAEIYVVSADGSNTRRVTHDAWYSSLPEWRPKG